MQQTWAKHGVRFEKHRGTHHGYRCLDFVEPSKADRYQCMNAERNDMHASIFCVVLMYFIIVFVADIAERQ